jgi:TonB family protein
MLNAPQHDPNAIGIAESRAHSRLQVHSLAYIELTDENAGLILNISETGIAVQAVQVLTSGSFPRMRFRLPRTENLIEAAGRLVWQIRSKKEAGIEFVGLPEKTRALIKAWIAAERGRTASPQLVVSRQAPPTQGAHPSAQIRSERDTSPLHGGVSKPPPISKPASTGPAASGTGPGGLSDWVSQGRHPTPSAERGAGSAPEERTSRFHLPPLNPRFPVESGPEDTDMAEPVRAMPRWNGYTAPGVGMELKKPRRWWTYTAALGFIAALGFAALMMFSPDTITRARIEALTRLHSNPAASSESGGQNSQANEPQQNNAGGTETAQNSQPPSYRPLASPNGAGSNPSANETQAAMPPRAFPAPDAGKNSAPAGLNRNSSSAAKSSAYGRPAAPSGTNRGQPAYRNQHEPQPRPEQYSSQNRQRQNAVAPYQPTERYSSTTAANPPTTPVPQAPAGNAVNTAGPPVGSVSSQPQANQNREPHAGSANGGNLQTQQNGAARPANQGVMEAWREQTAPPSATKPAANPASSSANQQPAQRDQDLYARGSTSGAAPSKPAGGTSSQPSVEISGSRTPVTPSVPLSGIPSGSVGATSQFHGFIIPPELQSRSSQLAGQLRIGQLVSSYSPVYPIEAAREGIEGTVKLDVTVNRDGSVKNVRVISGPAMLTSAAAAAVRDWRYEETFVAGEPVEAREYVTVVFRLAAR